MSLIRPASAASRQLLYEVVSGGSGLVLALFMWGHMVFVGSILTGARGFDWIALQMEVYVVAQPTGSHTLEEHYRNLFESLTASRGE